MAWLVRLMLFGGGALATLVVVREAPNFVVVQGMLALVILVATVGLMVAAPAICAGLRSRLLSRSNKKGNSS